MSFVLSHWVRLGELYPPALQALIELRDQNEDQCRSGLFTDRELFCDVLAINRSLNQTDSSIQLVEELIKTDVSLAEEYWSDFKSLAIAQQRLDWMKQFGLDFEEELKFLMLILESGKKCGVEPEIADSIRSHSEIYFKDQALQLILLARSLGGETLARQVLDKALTSLKEPEIAKQLQIDAEKTNG